MKLFKMKFRAKKRRPPPPHLISEPPPSIFCGNASTLHMFQSLPTIKQGRVFKFPEDTVCLASENLQTSRSK